MSPLRALLIWSFVVKNNSICVFLFCRGEEVVAQSERERQKGSHLKRWRIGHEWGDWSLELSVPHFKVVKHSRLF